MIYTWLKQIPRWLRSFPCILFSLPGPSGHFPFLPAVPLPARLISFSDPVLPRHTAPSLQPPFPTCHGHPCSPRSSTLTASSLLCSSSWPLPACGCCKRRTVWRAISKKLGGVCSTLIKIPEKQRSEKSRALFPAGACDGIKTICASGRKMNGKRKW